MAFCSRCGAEISDGNKICSQCGERVENGQNWGSAKEKFDKYASADDTTYEYDPQDIAANKGMGVLAYIGILVLIPWLAAPHSRFARFHVRQGVNLLLLSMVYGVLRFILGAIRVPYFILGRVYWGTPLIISIILAVIGIPLLVLMILGIVNAATGKAKELPFIGKINLFR